MKIFLYVVATVVMLILAIIGFILPIMPGMPFLFLSGVFFARVSKKFSNWYYRNKFYVTSRATFDGFKCQPFAKKVLYIIIFLLAMIALAATICVVVHIISVAIIT